MGLNVGVSLYGCIAVLSGVESNIVRNRLEKV